MNPTIFLSYSSADERIADKIDHFLVDNGYRVKRDTRDVGYKMNIRAFMKSIGSSDFVIALISDTFLCSPNCMYEMSELNNDSNYKKRLLQVILNNATGIFRPTGRLEYLNYWDDECKKLKSDLESRNYPNSVREDVEKQLAVYEKIRESIYEFTTFLSEEKGIKMADLEEEDYLTLINYISQRHAAKRSINNNISKVRNLESFSVGDKTWGIIKLIYNYGFFIQIQSEQGYRDGLLHKNKLEEFGYDFSQLKKFFKIGDDVHVKITEINYETPAAHNTGGLGFSPTYEFQIKLEDKIKDYLIEARKEKETLIDLRGLGLSDLPQEITGVESLERLFLGGNNFKEMPLELDSLPNLKTVFCDFTPKRQLPFNFVIYKTVKQNQSFL